MIPGEIFGMEVAGLQAEGEHALLPLQGFHGILVLSIGQDGTPWGHQVSKRPEGMLHILQVLEKVQVVRFNVQDHRYGRIKGQEGVAVLAGLQDNGFALPHPVAGAQDREGTANHHRGVNPGRHGNVGTHRGCGCFAVGAGDAQGILIPPHNGSPGLGPLEHRNAQGMGRSDLRVIIVDSGGADHQVLALHTLPPVADDHGDAQGTEMVYRRVLFHIRAGDDQAFSVEHFCQGGHGHSANPHQMRPFPGYNVIMDSIVCHCGLHTFSLPL